MAVATLTPLNGRGGAVVGGCGGSTGGCTGLGSRDGATTISAVRFVHWPHSASQSTGGGAAASVSVLENLVAVTTVVATDADENALTYGLAGGPDQAKFTINAATGWSVCRDVFSCSFTFP